MVLKIHLGFLYYLKDLKFTAWYCVSAVLYEYLPFYAHAWSLRLSLLSEFFASPYPYYCDEFNFIQNYYIKKLNIIKWEKSYFNSILWNVKILNLLKILDVILVIDIKLVSWRVTSFFIYYLKDLKFTCMIFCFLYSAVLYNYTWFYTHALSPTTLIAFSNFWIARPLFVVSSLILFRISKLDENWMLSNRKFYSLKSI